MEDNIDLKNIWHQQKYDHPNLEKTIRELKQYKSKSLRKTLIGNLLLITTVVLLGFLWYYLPEMFITSKIGLSLIFFAIVIFLFYFNKLTKAIKRVDTSDSNRDYLKNLNDLLSRQKFIQTNVMSLYFILLSVGLCLYLYEYTLLMNSIWSITTYAITLIWIAINWFYLRPKMVRKQESKINGLIKKFKDISRQINE